MSEPNQHERIAESLKQARRLGTEITPENLEENLHWMVHLAVPEVQAPDALRQRVQSLVAPPANTGHAPGATAPSADDPAAIHSGLRSLGRRFPVALPAWRRVLVGAVPLTVASIALLLLLFVAAPAPAGVLERILSAMAKVQSAHCTGWFISYEDPGPNGRPIPGRMRVHWWYQAPDSYRKSMGPEVPGWNREPATLVVQGEHGVLTSHSASGSINNKLSRPLLARWLSPLDFFSPTGILERAKREKNARVSTREGVYDDRPVRIVTVEVVQPEGREASRQRWVLHVDPVSDRIVKSNLRQDWRRDDGSWETMETETLERFEYDKEVNPSLFHVRFPGQVRPQPGMSQPQPRGTDAERPPVQRERPH
jgi:hypothetical protein